VTGKELTDSETVILSWCSGDERGQWNVCCLSRHPKIRENIWHKPCLSVFTKR